jgi:hypothetical protein
MNKKITMVVAVMTLLFHMVIAYGILRSGAVSLEHAAALSVLGFVWGWLMGANAKW